MKRYIFPILVIAIGCYGIYSKNTNFGFFTKLANQLPLNLLGMPIYQIFFGLVMFVGIIGLVEVFVTNRARKRTRKL